MRTVRTKKEGTVGDVRETLGQETAAEGTASFWDKIPRLPLAFLGLAAYRAWIEIAFVGSSLSTPVQEGFSRDLFDLSMIVVLLVCAAASKRLAPLSSRTVVYPVSITLMLASTACVFAALFAPQWAGVLVVPAAVTGGAGVALVILLWSELYSCLNPIRVALYYSASIVLAAVLVYWLKGLLNPWLCCAMGILPLATVLSVHYAFHQLPAEEAPRVRVSSVTFPWKPVLLMALYAFAYGLVQDNLTASFFGPHSSLGTLLVGACVFVGVLLRGRTFDFSLVYRAALPLMVGAFLIVPLLGNFEQGLTSFFVSASYTAFSILIMLILANMSYRYGIAAIWLFGIERSVRSIGNYLGRQTQGAVEALPSGLDPQLVIICLVVFLVVAGTTILLSEKELASKWGITFLSAEPERSEELAYRDLVEKRCQTIARRFHLSNREQEVLELVAQRHSNATIARDLFISEQTAKTHIRNLYRKLDVHSRDEVFDLLNDDDVVLRS